MRGKFCSGRLNLQDSRKFVPEEKEGEDLNAKNNQRSGQGSGECDETDSLRALCLTSDLRGGRRWARRGGGRHSELLNG
jgi:hypothetical protein